MQGYAPAAQTTLISSRWGVIPYIVVTVPGAIFVAFGFVILCIEFDATRWRESLLMATLAFITLLAMGAAAAIFSYKFAVPDKLSITECSLKYQTLWRNFDWDWATIDSTRTVIPGRSPSPVVVIAFNELRPKLNGKKSSYMIMSYWRISAQVVSDLINRGKGDFGRR